MRNLPEKGRVAVGRERISFGTRKAVFCGGEGFYYFYHIKIYIKTRVVVVCLPAPLLELNIK